MPKRHGMRYTKVYDAWRGMKKRCYQESYQHFDRYGGRGIKVCDRWKDNFLNFYEDMGDIPSDGYELDRIDNNGDYEPSNCRWVTKQENCRNRNFALGKSGFRGVYLRKSGKYSSSFNIDRNNRVHLGTFDTPEEAHSARIEAIKKHNAENNANLRVY